MTRYRYDEPATNDGEHSVAYSETEPRFSDRFSEARGHAMVQEVAPTGAVNTTWYAQSDTLRGRATRSQVDSQSAWESFDTLNPTDWSYTASDASLRFNRWEAESSPYQHQTGSASGGAWLSPSGGSGCTGSCFLSYGPYVAPAVTAPGQRATFRLAVATAVGYQKVARIDVIDHSSTPANLVLAARDLYGYEFGTGGLGNYRTFTLDFDSTGRTNHQLEYRVYWYGTTQVAHDRTEVEWTQGDNQHFTERVSGDMALRISRADSTDAILHRTASTVAYGQTMQVEFRLAAGNSTAVVGLESGSESTPATYRRLALLVQNGAASLQSFNGSQWSTVPIAGGTLTADKWYVLEIGLNGSGASPLRLRERDLAPSGSQPDYLYASATVSASQPWHFMQKIRNGTMWLDSYSEGNRYSNGLTRYSVEDRSSLRSTADLPRKHNWGNPPWPIYNGLPYYWVKAESQTSYRFEGDTTATATRQIFTYDSYSGATLYNTFGNVVKVRDEQLTTGGWVAEREQWTAYQPTISATRYLVALPAAQSLYSCPNGSCTTAAATLASLTHYLYDGSNNYTVAPTNGIPTGQRTLLRWAGAGNTDPRFYDERYGYDSFGNRTTTTRYSGEGTSSGVPQGSAITVTSTFDPIYHTYVTSSQGPILPATEWTYNYTLGLPISERVPVGMSGTTVLRAETTGEYDPFGRLTAIRRPGDMSGPETVKITYYDSYPGLSPAAPFMINIQQRQDASHVPTTRRFYNGLGEMIQQQAGVYVGTQAKDVVVDSDANPLAGGAEQLQSVAYELAPWNPSLNPTPWRGHVFINQSSYSQPYTKTTLDIAGRPVAVRGTDGSVQQHSAYSETQTQVWDAANALTTSTLNVWGQVTAVTPALGPGTSYTYDAEGQLTNTIYATEPTTITYDLAGRKVNMTDADMGYWTYSYDALGQLTQQTDARNQQVCFFYDQLGRMTSKRYQTSGACSPTAGQLGASYTYDANDYLTGNYGLGQRTGMADSSGTTAWRYDVRGRVTDEVRTVTGIGGSFRTAWTYDSADQPVTMAYPNGNSGATGEVVTTNYREGGAVLSVVGSDIYASGMQYDAAGRLTQQSLANATQTLTQGYFAWTAANGIGRLQMIQAGTSSAPASFLGLSYTYDSRGNISSITEATNSGQVQGFGYDALNRLTSASAGSPIKNGPPGDGAYSETYSYDAATGNLATKAGQNLSYTDTDHRHAATAMGNNAYSYDANGNMTQRIIGVIGGTTYNLAYDAESRLTSVIGGATNEAYTYDGDGVRIKVVNGNTTTVYIGAHYEYTLVGGTPATRSYYYAGAQRLAVRDSATGVAYLYGDHLGSASVAVSAAGAVVSRTRYKPWGEMRHQSGGLVTDRLFTGQLWDGDTASGGTGLYFYNARYYDPALGRFTQADTVVPNAKTPINFDRYAYTLNNPSKHVDPDGHCAGIAQPIRRIPGMATNCANIEMALRISMSPNAAPFERKLANDYLVLWGIGVGAGVAGMTMLGCSTVAACATAAETFLGIGVNQSAVQQAEEIGQQSLNLLSQGGGRSFQSYGQFTRVMGRAGDGMEWHHIVEQNPVNTARFGQNMLQNTLNIIKLPGAAGEIHKQISGFYSSVQPLITGNQFMRVRDWLSLQSFEFQYKFGIDIIIRFGGEQYIIDQLGQQVPP